MNDFVLCGFCQKCDTPLEYLGNGSWCSHNPTKNICKKFCEPVWFLSPKQMRIVFASPLFNKEVLDQRLNFFNEQGEALAELLDKNPFLVASILKDAGKENKEENK